MNNEKIKKILDKTDIYVLDEINILEYIDELEKVKEDYIKSLDKLDVLENRNNKAIEYIEERYNGEVLTHTFDKDNVGELLEILGSEKE